MRYLVAAFALAAAAAPASAESWEFTFSRQTLTPEEPSTTVTLWASFAPTDWAFAGANLSVLSTEAGWSDVSPLLPRPGQNPGVIDPGGTAISGISVNQVWSFIPLPPDPSNPLPVWQATFTVTDFAQRDIALSTLTSRYEVFPEVMGHQIEPRTPIDIETTIRVIPAPAPLALLAGSIVLATRRRRSPS